MVYLPPRRAIDVQQVVALLADEGDASVTDLARRLDWAYDRCLRAADRAAERGHIEAVLDSPRRDLCPECGAERFELVVVPGRFYCRRCGVATPGPNTEPPSDPEPEQIDLFATSEPTPTLLDPGARKVAARAAAVLDKAVADYERPPVDEDEAWMADEDSDQ